MANTTALSGAIGVNDQSAYLGSLTGLVAGGFIAMDREICKVISVPASVTYPVPLMRGQEGTANAAHPLGTPVKIGAPTTALGGPGDWTQPAAGAPSLSVFPAAPTREVATYNANGAIAIPRLGGDMVAILNGVTPLAMTVANPSVMYDGSKLTILSNGKAAHTVTYAAGLGNNGAGATVLTFKATQGQGVDMMSAGGFWVLLEAVAGAATVAGVGLA
jgi:hypothetical protein